jgi:hypothetical protein
MHHRKHMSRDHYLLCDVTADKENTASSIVACWTALTELLPDDAFIKSVAVFLRHIVCKQRYGHPIGQRKGNSGQSCE